MVGLEYGLCEMQFARCINFNPLLYQDLETGLTAARRLLTEDTSAIVI